MQSVGVGTVIGSCQTLNAVVQKKKSRHNVVCGVHYVPLFAEGFWIQGLGFSVGFRYQGGETLDAAYSTCLSFQEDLGSTV